MVEVMDHLHQYVPCVTITEKVSIPGEEEDTVEVTKDKLRPVVFGKLYVAYA